MKRIAIDLRTLTSIVFGNRRIDALDLLKLYREKEILLYNGEMGNPPIVIDENTNMVFYDVNTKEGKEVLKKYF
jgi:hypothetical protein